MTTPHPHPQRASKFLLNPEQKGMSLFSHGLISAESSTPTPHPQASTREKEIYLQVPGLPGSLGLVHSFSLSPEREEHLTKNSRWDGSRSA